VLLGLHNRQQHLVLVVVVVSRLEPLPLMQQQLLQQQGWLG
jgi:hypothetical protein